MSRAVRVIVPVSYLVLTLALTYPLVLHLGSAIPGDGFDGWQNYWNLWWERYALVDLGVSPFFCPLMDYPAGAGLLFHTMSVFNVWTLPIQVIAGLFAAYNSVVLFSFAIGGLGACLLARYVTRGRAGSAWGAWIAGLVFAFAPFHFAHLLGHLQVISIEWLPFAALFLLKAAGSRSPVRNGAIAGLFITLASLADWYQLLYLLLFTALYGLFLVARGRLTRQVLAALAGSSLVAVVLLAPLLGPMVLETASSRYMVTDSGDAFKYSADFLAFLLPNEMHPLWGEPVARLADRWTGNVAERMVSLGYIPLLLAAYGLRRALRRRGEASWLAPSGVVGIRFWALMAAAFGLLALGPVLHVDGKPWPAEPGLPLPYGWLAGWLPFISMARTVSRFDAMVMLALSVCVAWGFSALVGRLSVGARRGQAVVGLLIAALVCFESFPAPYRLTRPDTPEFYETLAADADDYAILSVPIERDHSQYLLYQTVHRKPLTSAYTSRGNPRTWMDRVPLLQQLRWPGQDHVIVADPVAVGPGVLHAAGIRYVVIDRARLSDPGARPEAVDLIARVFAGLPPTLDDGRLIVYDAWEPRFRELLRAAEPFPRLADGWSGEWLGSDGEMACFLEGSGEIVVHAATGGGAEVRLRFFNGAKSSRGLRISMEGAELAAHTLQQYEYVDLALPLALRAGDVRLIVEADGQGIQLHRVEVVNETGSSESARRALSLHSSRALR